MYDTVCDKPCKDSLAPVVHVRFSGADVGKTTRVEGGKVWYNGTLWIVRWLNATNVDGSTSVKTVDPDFTLANPGDVTLGDGTKFENYLEAVEQPAQTCRCHRLKLH